MITKLQSRILKTMAICLSACTLAAEPRFEPVAKRPEAVAPQRTPIAFYAGLLAAQNKLCYDLTTRPGSIVNNGQKK